MSQMILEYDEFCMFLLNMEVFNIMTPDFPYTSENEKKCTILYFCMFYFHLFNVLLKKWKNVDIFHEIDQKGYMSGYLSKPLTFFGMETYLYLLMICSMDISNVIYLFKKKIIDTIFFYSTLKSFFFLDFTKANYRLYCQNRVVILKKK
jgi:hypothetical protein